MDSTGRFLLGGALGAALGYFLSQRNQHRVAMQATQGPAGQAAVHVPVEVEVEQQPLSPLMAAALAECPVVESPVVDASVVEAPVFESTEETIPEPALSEASPAVWPAPVSDWDYEAPEVEAPVAPIEEPTLASEAGTASVAEVTEVAPLVELEPAAEAEPADTWVTAAAGAALDSAWPATEELPSAEAAPAEVETVDLPAVEAPEVEAAPTEVSTAEVSTAEVSVTEAPKEEVAPVEVPAEPAETSSEFVWGAPVTTADEVPVGEMPAVAQEAPGVAEAGTPSQFPVLDASADWAWDFVSAPPAETPVEAPGETPVETPSEAPEESPVVELPMEESTVSNEAKETIAPAYSPEAAEAEWATFAAPQTEAPSPAAPALETWPDTGWSEPGVDSTASHSVAEPPVVEPPVVELPVVELPVVEESGLLEVSYDEAPVEEVPLAEAPVAEVSLVEEPTAASAPTTVPQAEAAPIDDLKARIEETRRRIRQELEQPFISPSPAQPIEDDWTVSPALPVTHAQPEAPVVHEPEPAAAPAAEPLALSEEPEEQAEPETDEVVDYDSMRSRIEVTRSRLKAKAFDAMMTGEAALLGRDTEDAEHRRKIVPAVDSEVNETIESSLREEQD